MSAPEWIVPGAPVLLVRRDRDTHRRPLVKRTTVDRVAKQSFTVAGCEQRIKLDSLRSADQGSTWHSWCWEVLHPESERAAALLAKAKRNNSRYKIRAAMDEWLKGDDAQQDDLTVIRSLLSVLSAHGDLVLEQDGG